MMRRTVSVPSIAFLASLAPLSQGSAAVPRPAGGLSSGQGGMPGGVAAVRINEIRIDDPDGGDPNEYFELVGPPGTLLDGLTYLVIGDNPGGNYGFIESVTSLGGQVIPPSGFFVVGEGSMTIGVPDHTTGLDFENNDTVTHMLVSGFTVLSQDIDTNNDGIANNVLPWTSVVDVVAIVHPSSNDFPYGPGSGVCVAGPNCQQITQDPPSHVFRCSDGTGSWQLGTLAINGVPPEDSPGSANPCTCGDGILVTGEECDDMGETAGCDANCTMVECGDLTINSMAGEECDDTDLDGKTCTSQGFDGGTLGCDAITCELDTTTCFVCGDGLITGEPCDGDGMGMPGETATCNLDCTVAVCGDGIVNTTAGETCDDGGRTETCDSDCTVVTCGDGLVNMAVGEQCDGDGMGTPGETTTCDDDCTVAVCGDMVLNATAGEECDDGGESASCNTDCTTAACGDGQINATAFEDCDDIGESEICDDDCTMAECGDGTLNTTAGEECDDGNTTNDDGCSSACLREEDDTSTGGSSDTGDTGGGTGVMTTGPASTGPISSTTEGASTGEETDAGTGGAVVGAGDGCNCVVGNEGQRHGGMPWSLLGLLGLGAIRGRRSSRP
ncbi:hypothetical protein [Paraliomyxa miuraensis]|uniref:hypothetical protein n=1 Tax=Paraliomyxa miuraensis TaxID=376150 RepID=UPI00225618B2|nr:hypothetical protein [Paraliomyxa miuraensis]MCX4246329.1 hypothetical protein [Paraliomyxa miuraensis]